MVTLIVALATVGIILLVSGTDGLRDALTTVGDTRWGVVAFIVAYAAAFVILLPGTLGTFTAGAVYGFPAGAFVALAGATLGSTVAFLIARSMGREGAQSLFGARVQTVDDLIGRNDFSSILLLRLMPIVPFNLLNYGSGLSAVRLSRYVPASVVGMAPGTFLAAGLADQADEPTGAPFLIMLVLFVIALAASWVIGQRMRPAESP